VRRLWIFLHAGIGLILLYLKIQYLLNCLFGNGSWMRELGRHWYFLNLVFLPGKCPAKDKFRPYQDMTSRKRILYPFVLPHGPLLDVNGNFVIVLKEHSIWKRGQPRPEAPGTNFVRIPLGPVATSNYPKKYRKTRDKKVISDIGLSQYKSGYPSISRDILGYTQDK